jgi:hypothetical protein
VEGTLEWARAQAASIMTRAQQGAEQLLGAAGLGEDKVGRVADSLVQAADREAQSARAPGGVIRPATAQLQATAPAVPTPSPAPAEQAPEPEIEEPEASAESGGDTTEGWRWGSQSSEPESTPPEDEPPTREEPPRFS